MNSYTHKYMTKHALNMIISINNKSIYKNDVDNFVNVVEEFSTRPDTDENDGMYTTHFYNPATGLNYNGKKMTALEKMKIHISGAIKAEKDKNKNKKMEEIGRAIHFIQDICTPVHTYYEDKFDAVYRLRQHIRFEEICDNLCKVRFWDEGNIETAELFKENSIVNTAKYFAGKSSMLFYELENNNFLNEKKYFHDESFWQVCLQEKNKKKDEVTTLHNIIGMQAIANGIIATYTLLDKFGRGNK